MFQLTENMENGQYGRSVQQSVIEVLSLEPESVTVQLRLMVVLSVLGNLLRLRAATSILVQVRKIELLFSLVRPDSRPAAAVIIRF